MKGLYFTDIHTYPFNEFSQPTEDGRTTLLREHERTYQWIAEMICHHKPDFVVNLGDTALTHGYLDSMSLTCIEQGYRDVRDACTSVKAKLYWMLGNHDLMNDSVRIHSLPFIKEIVANVQVDGTLLFLPFYRDFKNLNDEAIHHLVDGPRIERAFIHLDIIGARYNMSGMMSKEGVDPNLWRGDVQVYAGHYHHPQVLGTNFNVIGSCMFRNFSDEVVEGVPRGIIVDTFGDFPLRIENPHTSVYCTIKQSDDNIDEFRRKLEIPHPERVYVRIIYPPSMEDVVAQYVSEYRGVRLVQLGNKKKTTVPVSMPSAFDPHKVVDAYIEKVPPTEDLESIKVFGHKLVDEVLGGILKHGTHSARFSSMHVENFLSIGGMDIRFDLDGVIYVDGVVEGAEADVSNGAGKSSIFEAFYWCLFGDLIRGGAADDCVNTQFKKNCLVSLYCIVDDVEFQFLRTRKHKDYGNDLRVYREGSLIAQGTTGAGSVLQDILGTKEDIFRHTTLLVDSLSTRFSLLNGRQRMELLESVIQAQLYDLLYNKIHDQCKEGRQRFVSILTSIERDERVVAELQTTLDGLRSTLEVTEASLNSTILQKQSEMQQLNLEATTLGGTIQSRAQGIEQLRVRVQEAEKQLKDSQPDIKKNQAFVRTLNGSIAVQKKLIQDKEKLSAGQCPTCLRPYSSETLSAEIQHLREDLASNEGRLAQWDAFVEQQRQTEATIQESISTFRSQRMMMEGKVSQMNAQLTQCNTRIRGLQDDITNANSQLEKQRQQVHGMTIRVEEVRVEIGKLKQDHLQQSQELVIMEYWDTGFSPKGGCRLWLLADAVNQLNDFVVDYSSMVSVGRVMPQLTIGNNAINLEVVSQGGDYKRSSSGERRMVDLSIQLALAKLSSRYSGFTSNVMILDEVDDKLDASARRRLVSVLGKLSADENRTVFIASHYKDIRSYADHVLTVVKKDEISFLASAA